jgi:hypothetical protein
VAVRSTAGLAVRLGRLPGGVCLGRPLGAVCLGRLLGAVRLGHPLGAIRPGRPPGLSAYTVCLRHPPAVGRLGRSSGRGNIRMHPDDVLWT